MEDSRGVIPNEPTQRPNELLHQASNHISVLYPGPFRLPTPFAAKIDALCDLYLARVNIIWPFADTGNFIHPRGGFYVADMVQIDPLLRDHDLLLVSRGADLDTQLIRQNWPTAVKIAGGRAADQWYLGPQDQRVPMPGKRDQRHFVFARDQSGQRE